MQMKWIEPSTLWATRLAKRGGKESGEFGAGHLARRHREVAMADFAEPTDVAVDCDVIGRISEDHFGFFAVHEIGDHAAIQRVAADKPVRPEPPDISRPTARRRSVRLGEPIICRIALFLGRKALDQLVDLSDRKARDADVEAEVSVHQLLQLEGEQLLVPAGVEGELIVGQHIGPLLGRRQMADAKAGRRRHAEFARRLGAAVPGENAIVAVDQHRVGEAEAADAFGDLADLFARMNSCVARPGPQFVDGDGFERASVQGASLRFVRLNSIDLPFK